MSDMVPEAWPSPNAEPPVAAKPIAWWAMLPMLAAVGLIPSRVGPRLSVSDWTKAVFTHLASLLVLVGIISLAVVWIERGFEATPIGWSQLSLSERMRLPFALPVFAAYLASERRGDIYGVFAVMAMMHVGCWAAAWWVMPFVAAGEPTRRLYFRSLKLMLWSTAALVPAAALVLLVAYIGTRWGEQLSRITWNEGLVPAVAFGLLWWLSVVLRLGARYAGPADGPGWAPRTPQCSSCGYMLIGLPLDGRCPECGLEVRNSTSESRHPPPWATASGVIGKTGAYWRTAFEIVRQRDFFKRLSLHQSVQSARRFGYATSVAISVLTAIGFTSAALQSLPAPGLWSVRGLHVSLILLSAALVPGLVHLALTLLAATVAGRLGKVGPRASSVAAG